LLTKKEFKAAQEKAAEMIRKAGIGIAEKEIEKMDVADFGLSNLAREGAQILTFFSTDRVSAKVIALFPGQTLPEHWHTAIGVDPGKEEIIRVIEGTVYFYIQGPDTITHGLIPVGKEAFYNVRHEIIMKPCDQITLEPGTKHWFQAGPDGAVMYSFSSAARDALDPFTDPEIVRVTKIE
jgi:D-lyxose ketol-isomerase